MDVTTERHCVHCGGPLLSTSRVDAKFCKDSCRSNAYKARRRAARTQLVPDDRGAAGAGLRRDQLEQLREAVASAIEEPKLVAVVAAEARQNWRAAAWLLSRTHPERWGERGREEPRAPEIGPPGDPFREVDQLAARRRKPDGY